VTGTHGLDSMRRLATMVKPAEMRVIDAPVVFGMQGA
jgi:hypothetical protein